MYQSMPAQVTRKKKIIKIQSLLAAGKGENDILALRYRKGHEPERYLIIWRHDRPAWVSAWRPYAWFLVWRHLVEAGVLAVLEPGARAPGARARAAGRPVGLGAVLLLLLRRLRRGLRLLLRCCLLLMLVLLLLILGGRRDTTPLPLPGSAVTVMGSRRRAHGAGPAALRDSTARLPRLKCGVFSSWFTFIFCCGCVLWTKQAPRKPEWESGDFCSEHSALTSREEGGRSSP